MSKWSVKQTKAIEHMALGNRTQQEIAEEIGIKPQTLSSWKKLPGFMDAVLTRAKELLRTSIPEVYHSLSMRSKAGSDRHIKIFLDHLEKLEEVKASRANITFTWLPPTATKETDDGPGTD